MLTSQPSTKTSYVLRMKWAPTSSPTSHVAFTGHKMVVTSTPFVRFIHHTHTNQPFLCVIGIMSEHRDEDDVLCVFLCDEMGKKERTGIFGFIP